VYGVHVSHIRFCTSYMCVVENNVYVRRAGYNEHVRTES